MLIVLKMLISFDMSKIPGSLLKIKDAVQQILITTKKCEAKQAPFAA